jgi:predicted PurR-regulated permease PerM
MTRNNFILLAFIFAIISSGFIFQNYLSSIFIAFILTLATSPLHEILKKKYSVITTSSILVILFFTIVFVPLLYLIGSSYKYLSTIDIQNILNFITNIVYYLKHLPSALDFMQDSVDTLLNKLEIYTVDIDVAKKIVGIILNFLMEINSITYEFFLILFFYFIFNLYSKKIFFIGMSLIPLKKNEKRILHEETSNIISSVFFSTIFSMLLQGFAFAMFLVIFTDFDFIYFGIMAAFFSVIPVIGSYLVAIPLAFVLLIQTKFIIALSMIIFAIIIMTFLIDNILRVIFMTYIHKKFHLHYSISNMLILLAMIAGVGVFGGWGIIIAPAILTMNLAIMHIYRRVRG